MNNNETLGKLVYAEGGVVQFSPCIEFVGLCNAPLADCASGYLQAANIFQRAIKNTGATPQWWRTNNMKHMRRWDSASDSMLPFWLQDETALREPVLGLFAQAGSAAPGCEPPLLEFYHEQIDPEHPQGGIRLGLGVAAITDANRLFELACAAFNHVPIHYGWAGYGLAWHLDNHDTQNTASRILPPWLMRYPGLGSGDIMPAILASRAGLLTINWITFIGPAMVATLGGPDALRQGLGGGASVRQLESGAIAIRACEQPALGDVNRGDPIEAYKQVGALLAPVRVADAVLEELTLMFITGDQKLKWLKRFFPAE